MEIYDRPGDNWNNIKGIECNIDNVAYVKIGIELSEPIQVTIGFSQI